jgi:uncharacterized protein (TIGR02284 family)
MTGIRIAKKEQTHCMESLTIKTTQSLKNRYIAQKLNFLLNILQESKHGYDNIASQIPDRSIQRAIESLAMECSQYIAELNAQVSSLGVEPIIFETTPFTDRYRWSHTKNWDETATEEVLSACVTREKLIIKAYREVLNDPSLDKHLRSMITYQLNGMLYAFVRVKLLNTTLTH